MPYTYETPENGYALLEDGDYEAVIESIEPRVTPNGKRKLSIQFRIRGDVEQKGKNRVMFDDVWAERDNPDYYNRRRINQLLSTQKIEDGHVFEDVSSVIEFLKGSYLIIHVTTEFDNYKGEDVNTVQYVKPSKNGPAQIGDAVPAPAAKPAQGGAFPDEDDLPF